MNEKSGIMLALLAAGQSRRFGNSDKLTMPLGDRMLGLHAAATVADMPFAKKLVIDSPRHPCAADWNDLGYQVIANNHAARGQATSVRLAALHAIEFGASALCIMLADMPFVTREQIGSLIAAFEQSGGADIIASSRDGKPMPPAIFPSGSLEHLISLKGDTGARLLLANARLIAGNDPGLMDIDTEEDFAKAEMICLDSE